MPSSNSFSVDREAAAGLFAQTMIVIDDEAIQSFEDEFVEPVKAVVTPHRGMVSTTQSDPIKTKKSNKTGNILDARTLIEGALDLGIVCSVLRTKKEPGLKKKIVRTAKNADIVTLDWEIEDDSGKLAKEIIVAIEKSDRARNGRVRLISIYTSSRNRTKILADIKDCLNEECKGRYRVDEKCVSNYGTEKLGSLRIICLYKTTGIKAATSVQKPYVVSEKNLPRKLLEEFSHLSTGLLGNVAMATIASIRDVTHHVLNTFDGKMDGPYFHHRAAIEKPHEAEDYAIDLVLSEIKKSVIRKDIKPFLDVNAIARSISEKLSGLDQTLTYRTKGSKAKDVEVNFTEDQIKLLITLGINEFDNQNHSNGAAGYSKKGVKSGISTLFEQTVTDAKQQLAKFASLSQLGFQPHGHRVLCGDLGPVLSTGTIIQQPRKGAYLLCLQASCDSVRRTKISPFIFAKLLVIEELSDQPVFVVPSLEMDGNGYTILAIDKSAYTNLEYINFVPNETTEMVAARKSPGRKGFHFFDSDENAYRWLGNSKNRRSLRAVHNIAQNMSRIGFDEFAPFSTDG